MSDQRAMLDSCTNSPDCQGDFHLLCCPSTSRHPKPEPQPDRQTWERRIGGTDLAEMRVHLDVGLDGRALVPEPVLAQLLSDAGWERTA